MSEVFADLVEMYEKMYDYEEKPHFDDTLNRQLLLDSYSDGKLQELLYVESIKIIFDLMRRYWRYLFNKGHKLIHKHDMSHYLVDKLITEWNETHDVNNKLHINETTHLCNNGTEPILYMMTNKENFIRCKINDSKLSKEIEDIKTFKIGCIDNYGPQHIVSDASLKDIICLERNYYKYKDQFIERSWLHAINEHPLFEWCESANSLIIKDESNELDLSYYETAAIIYYLEHKDMFPIHIDDWPLPCIVDGNEFQISFIGENDDEKVESLKRGYVKIEFDDPVLDLKCCLRGDHIGSLTSNVIKIEYGDCDNAAEDLIYYFGERLNDAKLLYEHTRRELELERIYHHISDLKKYETELICNVETLERRENVLKESIGIRTFNLKRLENEIMSKTCELDILDQRLKDLTFATQTNAYIEENYSRIQDEIQKFNQKVTMVDYYNKHYKAFQGYRASYLHFDYFSKTLDEKRSNLKAKKKDHSLRYRERLNDLSKTFEQKKHEFDNYKTEMESKFKDHQHKIDTYDDVVNERDRYLKEMNDLREQLETMTSERDKYKITVETMMQYRK